jgi:hypothetical protein
VDGRNSGGVQEERRPRGLVRKLNVKGKRGDSIVLPKPSRGSASAKSVNTVVTTISASGGSSVVINLTAHYEYSRLIEDIAEVQALASMRKFYTDDAGYALSLKKDSVLFDAARTLNGGDGASTWTAGVIAGDGTTAFVDASGNANATAITDAGIRRVIQVLDDNDIPMNDRFLAIPPVARRIMMGLARFTEQAFVGDGKTIRNGKLGDVYGVSVHVTSNCPAPTSATTAKVGLLAHRTRSSSRPCSGRACRRSTSRSTSRRCSPRTPSSAWRKRTTRAGSRW